MILFSMVLKSNSKFELVEKAIKLAEKRVGKFDGEKYTTIKTAQKDVSLTGEGFVIEENIIELMVNNKKTKLTLTPEYGKLKVKINNKVYGNILTNNPLYELVDNIIRNNKIANERNYQLLQN